MQTATRKKRPLLVKKVLNDELSTRPWSCSPEATHPVGFPRFQLRHEVSKKDNAIRVHLALAPPPVSRYELVDFPMKAKKKKTKPPSGLAYPATICELRRYLTKIRLPGWGVPGGAGDLRPVDRQLPHLLHGASLPGRRGHCQLLFVQRPYRRPDLRCRKIGSIFGCGVASPCIASDSRASAFPYTSSLSAFFDFVACSGFNAQSGLRFRTGSGPDADLSPRARGATENAPGGTRATVFL